MNGTAPHLRRRGKKSALDSIFDHCHANVFEGLKVKGEEVAQAHVIASLEGLSLKAGRVRLMLGHIDSTTTKHIALATPTNNK